MKVFTVGLDASAKPPKEAEALPEKVAPPPGYATSTTIAMAPELARGTPIIVRKSRGYKGVLMVMLAVFLIAIFALTVSEIAYNRQRDENFFRLRWAEMKQRMGYGPPMDAFDLYQQQRPLQPVAMLQLQPELAPASTTTTESPTSDVTRQMIDPAEPLVLDPQQPMGQSGSGSSSSGSSEVRDPMEQLRDARLQFLKRILKKIREHAQQMGFDGTMQVSVIEMDPHEQQQQQDHSSGMEQQQMFGGGGSSGGNGFFPSRPAMMPDSFQQPPPPMFLQNNQLGGDELFHHRPVMMPMPMPLFIQPQMQMQQWPLHHQQQPQQAQRQEDGNQWQQPQQQQWPIRPEMAMPFFRPQQPPMDWQQQQQQPMMGAQMLQQQFAMPPQPQPIEQQPNFESSQPAKSSAEGAQEPAVAAGEVYGRKFGRMLQDIIAANRMQQQQQPQQQFQFQGEPSPFAHAQGNVVAPSMMQQQQWPQPQPIVAAASQEQQQQQPKEEKPFPQFPQFPPQQRPPMIFFPLQSANQQQMPEQEGNKRPFPFFKSTFVAPEDRIQIEPPTPTPVVEPMPLPVAVAAEGERPDWSDETNKAAADGSGDESASKPHLVDGNVEAASTAAPQGANVGWTHQQQQPQQQNSGEVLISADSANAPSTDESAPAAEVTRDPEDRFLTGPPDFSKQQQQEEVVPAEQPKRQPDMDLQRPIPIDTSIDFPAVKFPTTSAATESTERPADGAVAAPQQDGLKASGSNPVFFQVDDPVAAEQQPQQQMPIRTVA